MRAATVLLFTIMQLASSTALASEAARLHLYIFKKGLPVEGMALSAGRSPLGMTDMNGALHVSIQPGQHYLSLRHNTAELRTMTLDLHPGESLLIIANIDEDDSTVNLEIESSHGNTQGNPVPDENSGMSPAAPDEALATLTGRVSTFQEGTPIPGARIFISGTSEKIRSDTEGRFNIRIPAGIYAISVIHPDFTAQAVEDIVLTKGETIHQNFALTPNALALEEFVVTAPYLEGSFSALADEQRNSSAVAEVMSADQMSNSGDSDAAGALKRVTGLTVVDGKFVYVRGLGDRYSSTTLNNASLPSPDPIRRVIPLDIFPTGVLGSIVIQKTYSPDMPGEFGGGSVQLRTRGLPEERIRKLSVSLGGNTRTTFQDGLSYEGGNTDFLGIDDGTREFPELLDQMTNGGRELLTGLTPEQVESAGESLSPIYATEPVTMPPNVGFKLNLGDRYEDYNGKWGWGYLFGLNYKNDWILRNEERTTYGLNGLGGLNPLDESTMQITTNEIDLGGILHLSLELGNNHTMESTTLLTRQTNDRVLFEEGFLSENSLTVRDTTLEWVENQLFMEQLRGNHSLPRLNDLMIDWQATYATASRDEPDTRFYRYEQREDGLFAFSDKGQSNETSFEELDDKSTQLGIDFTFPVYDLFGAQTDFKFGFNYLRKKRASAFSRFRFLTDFSRNNIRRDDLVTRSPEEILNAAFIGPDGYQLRNTTLPTDNYTAEQTVNAQYLMADTQLKRFKVMGGVRLERSRQEVTTFQLTNPDQATKADLDDTDILPALTLTWLLGGEQQLRMGVSRTVNRPDFKELSEAPYIDPDSRWTVIGNPRLERAIINHFDLRWEWYLTKFEGLSAALFYKDFDQPIEQVIRLGAGGIRSFANAESAVNYGLELQGRAWLSRFFGRKLSRYYVESNVSLIESKVKLGDAGAQQTNPNRALQGQAPWVVNFTLGYENLITTTKAALLFNMAGEFISSVGTKGLPDAYAQPAPLLDFVYSRNLYEGTRGNKLKLKFKAQNILDPTIEILRGDEVERSTRKGITLKTSLEYKFP